MFSQTFGIFGRNILQMMEAKKTWWKIAFAFFEPPSEQQTRKQVVESLWHLPG